MIRFLLCDDDANELRQLETLLAARYGEDTSLTTFTDPHEALDYFEGGGLCDAAILDIIMPEMKGTALAAALRQRGFDGAIIFLTTSRGFAPESYELEALDYILKPVEAGRLDRALDKLESHLFSEDHAGIVLTLGKTTQRVLLRDILYIEAGDHMAKFALESGETLTVRRTFGSFAPLLLGDPRFAQCHGSFIVNMDQVRSLCDHDAILQNAKHIPIAKRYASFKKQYLKWLTREG